MVAIAEHFFGDGGDDIDVCVLNWPLPIGDFQDQYKHTMINKYSNEHNHVKNLNWQEANQLAIYKRSREVELGLPRTT